MDVVPLWGLFAATVAVVLLSMETGYRLGRYRRQRAEDEKEGPVGAVVGATLALLGFILAFAFGMAATRFDARRQIVVDEANAIETTYLRAGLLPDNRGERIRPVLSRYVDSRLEVVRSRDVAQALRQADELHRELWREAEALGQLYPDSIVVGLFIQSLNETIEVHAKRFLVSVQSRIPAVIWAALYLVTFLTMLGVGYFSGLTRSRRSVALLVLALTFSAIMALVADLDRSQEGLLKVNQRAMQDVQNMMHDNQ
jgi:hypothetical protein